MSGKHLFASRTPLLTSLTIICSVLLLGPGDVVAHGFTYDILVSWEDI